MKKAKNSRALDKSADLIWERPEPAARSIPEPLNRSKIVSAAIAIADREDLAAVSIRNVGAALNAGPMRLYGYIATKEELFELMADEVFGEIIIEETNQGDWRESLRSIAQQIRKAARRHRWFIDLLGGRPHVGPNALVHLERLLAAFDSAPGSENIDQVLQAVKTINAFLIGAIQSEAGELRAAARSGMDKTAWQATNEAYIRERIATNRFPTIAKVVDEAAHVGIDEVFAEGLECVLDGIELRFSKNKKRNRDKSKKRQY